MTVKSREKSKFYIEQFVLDNENNPGNWNAEQLKQMTNNHVIIGYLFSTKEAIKFGTVTRTLNVYLIDPKHYHNTEGFVTLSELQIKWLTFNEKCFHGKTHQEKNVFRNPPIKEWLDTKDNWCMKQANFIATKYKMDFNEAFSEVGFIICKLFRKGTVYMGNLGYLQIAINNSILMRKRYDKNRLYGDKCVSMDAEMYEDLDGAATTLHDIVGKEDEHYADDEYKCFEDAIFAEMRKSFSEREIDQIVNNKGYLPMNLYRRLIKWRKLHTAKDIVGGAFNE